MYIKKSDRKFLINFDYFDGIMAEKQDNGVYLLCLFRLNAEHSFRKLAKCIFPIGRYHEEQAESILSGIEKSIEEHKMVYIISEPEVRNA